MKITFTRLKKTGDWGVRIELEEADEQVAFPDLAGSKANVSRRDGDTSTVTLGKCIWHSDEQRTGVFEIDGSE